MNTTEFVIYALVGGASGLSVSAGFMFQLIRIFYVEGKPVLRTMLYYPIVILSCISVGVAPVFVIVGFVMVKGWEDEGAWPRLLVFSLGVFVGLSVAIYSAHLVFRQVNELRRVGTP